MLLHKVGGNCDTPALAKVCRLFKAGGHRLTEISHMTKIPNPTISRILRILKEDTSRHLQKGRQYKPYKILKDEVQQIIQYLLKCYTT